MKENLRNMKQEILERIRHYLKQFYQNEPTGHDYWHFVRVSRMAIHIAKIERADKVIVEVSALLHDIGDWKFCESEIVGQQKLYELMNQFGLQKADQEKIAHIVFSIGYKGHDTLQDNLSLEAQVVQDADRLDALGAIGIARTFAYGGFKHRTIYDPGVKPITFVNAEEYKNSNSTTINHFYEKLLKLPDLLFTHTAKAMANERANFMKQYLEQFYNEWNFLE